MGEAWSCSFLVAAAAPGSPTAGLQIGAGKAEGPPGPRMACSLPGPSRDSGTAPPPGLLSPSCPAMPSQQVPVGLSHNCACTERQSNLCRAAQQGGD